MVSGCFGVGGRFDPRDSSRFVGGDVRTPAPERVDDQPTSNQHDATYYYADGVALRLEYTVEPFVEGDPGPHVQAALDAGRGDDLAVEFGPFGTTVEGEDRAVLAAAGRILDAALGAGASRVSLMVVRAS